MQKGDYAMSNSDVKGYKANAIKPIETHYKGYRFRSRLEARWAVFFDALGIDWEYEKEGFNLGEVGCYLPDFWLPHPVNALANSGWGIWVEIKPTVIDAEGLNKVTELVKLTKHNALIFQGSPAEGKYFVTKISGCHFDPPKRFDNLKFVNPSTIVDGTRIYHGSAYLENDEGFTSYPTVYSSPSNNWCVDLDKAYSKALSARFEHGEAPA